jgi:hypothetical protein
VKVPPPPKPPPKPPVRLPAFVVVLAVEVRGEDVPVTTESPAFSPLVIAAYWVVISPTVTARR